MTIGIDPNICQIGTVTVEWHGLLMALGIAVALGLAMYLAKKDDIPQEHLLSPASTRECGSYLGEAVRIQGPGRSDKS